MRTLHGYGPAGRIPSRCSPNSNAGDRGASSIVSAPIQPDGADLGGERGGDPPPSRDHRRAETRSSGGRLDLKRECKIGARSNGNLKGHLERFMVPLSRRQEWQFNRIGRPLPNGTCVVPTMPCRGRRWRRTPRRAKSTAVTMYRRMVIIVAARSWTRMTDGGCRYPYAIRAGLSAPQASTSCPNV